MAVKALSRFTTIDYVSDEDPCKKKTKVPVDPKDPAKGTREEETIEEGATYFGLRPLDVFLNGFIFDNASHMTGKQGSQEVGIQTRINQTNLESVRFGLVYFKNFFDDKGVERQVVTDKVKINGRDYEAASDDTLNLLGLPLVAELAEQIRKISEVSKVEAKNSEPGLPL